MMLKKFPQKIVPSFAMVIHGDDGGMSYPIGSMGLVYLPTKLP